MEEYAERTARGYEGGCAYLVEELQHPRGTVLGVGKGRGMAGAPCEGRPLLRQAENAKAYAQQEGRGAAHHNGTWHRTGHRVYIGHGQGEGHRHGISDGHAETAFGMPLPAWV